MFRRCRSNKIPTRGTRSSSFATLTLHVIYVSDCGCSQIPILVTIPIRKISLIPFKECLHLPKFDW